MRPSPEFDELTVPMWLDEMKRADSACSGLELVPKDPPPARGRALEAGYIEDENPEGFSIPTATGGVVLFGAVLLAAFWDGVLAWWGE